jgi:hypothetical protein
MQSLRLSLWIPLGLTLLAYSARAGTIAVYATCDGVAYGPTSATCGGGPGSPVYASATVDINNTGPGFNISVSAQTISNVGHPAYASASITGDFAFLVTGGLTQGFFEPCVDIGADANGDASGFLGNSFFGPVQSFGPFQSRQCGLPTAFTAGVALTLWAGLRAEGETFFNGGQSAEGMATVLLFDSSMNPSGGDYSLTEIGDFGPPAVPEPSSGWLVLCGVPVLLTLQRCRRYHSLCALFTKPCHQKQS